MNLGLVKMYKTTGWGPRVYSELIYLNGTTECRMYINYQTTYVGSERWGYT